jgi:signal transduction histidine kinase
MAVNAITTLILRASGWVQKILYTFYGSLLVYFSISGFYINYTGLVSIYPITYPNYYYEVLILQLSAITLVIILKYKHMFNENILLLNQKIQLQKEMHQEIIAAQVEERRKIARDLHDDMGATLSTVNLLFTDQYPHNIQLLKLIRKACNDIRVFAKKFSIKEMKDETLSNTLNAHLEVLNAAGKTQFSLVVVGQEPVLEEEIKYNLVRIAFELLTNILKHSNAQNATVQLVFEQNQLLIITEDDGIGYDIHLVSKGNGLANMEKRASQISASLHVSSDKKGTTTILNMTINKTKNETNNFNSR